MSNYEKTGHPVLGTVLGILGIAAAVLLCFITGVIGGAIACVLGLTALLIGISARKKAGKGLGAIITGALAILLAVVLTVGSVGMYREIQQRAQKYADEAPLVVRSLDKPYLGMVGMIASLPRDEGSLNELVEQFNLIRDRVGSGAPAEEKPAEAEAAEEKPAE